MKRYIRRSNDINIVTNTRKENKNEECPKKEKKKIKFNFKKSKENTLHSLYEVEHFLCDFKHIHRYIKLYFLLK